MKLGEYVKQYRTEHDLTTRDFASMSGLTSGYISMLENNRNPRTGKPISPKAETYQKIASATGVTLEALISIVEDRIKIREAPKAEVKGLSLEAQRIAAAYDLAEEYPRRIVRTVLEPYLEPDED